MIESRNGQDGFLTEYKMQASIFFSTYDQRPGTPQDFGPYKTSKAYLRPLDSCWNWRETATPRNLSQKK